jgi:lipopolysaccharide/colanic/teichoic acid biosynthesis glycosyltransferase
LASPLHRFAKRTLDVTLSLAILVFVYPFVILASDKNSTVRKLVSQTPAVLFGKKSLIGAPESFVKRKRTEEKAGVTGLWFLENVSENNLEELEKLDLYYAKNHSVWLDLDILGKTILKLVNGE